MSVCAVLACDRPVYGKQPWCEAHYRRVRRTGAPGERPIGAAPAPPEPCSVDRCARTATERGLCHAHYLRVIRLGDVHAQQPLLRRGPRRRPTRPARRRRSRALPTAQVAPLTRTCAVDGCGRPATSGSLCRSHRNRLVRSGDVQVDVPLQRKGTAGHVVRGYRFVMVSRDERWLTNGVAKEAQHRLVMARALGRPLGPDESVHHRNGDRLDNRIENLELWSRYQPRGQRAEDKVRYAVEILSRYAPEKLAPGEQLEMIL